MPTASRRTPARKVAAAKTPRRPSAPLPAPRPVVQSAPKARGKVKPVRDSFTMPPDDHALIGQIKQRALQLQHPAKKSEVLRAGLKALASMTDAALKAMLESVPPLKTGRPKAPRKAGAKE
jgi:hypothetical protein